MLAYSMIIDTSTPTRWGKQRVRYVFLRELMQWVKSRPGVGTPSIRGFHDIVGGKARISWTRFYHDHFKTLQDEGYLDYQPDRKTGVCALIITQKALDEIEL